MEENNKSLTSAPAEAEAEIDLLELAQKLWAERKLILKMDAASRPSWVSWWPSASPRSTPPP